MATTPVTRQGEEQFGKLVCDAADLGAGLTSSGYVAPRSVAESEWSGRAHGPALPDPPASAALAFRASLYSLGTRHPKLVVESDGSLEALKELKLMAKVNEVPATKSTGKCLASWQPGVAPLEADGSLRLELAQWPDARGEVLCRLFASPAAHVTIVHPPMAQAVL